MNECKFCDFYAWIKTNELADQLEVALVQRIGISRTTHYFPSLRFCPLCGKKLDGGDHP